MLFAKGLKDGMRIHLKLGSSGQTDQHCATRTPAGRCETLYALRSGSVTAEYRPLQPVVSRFFLDSLVTTSMPTIHVSLPCP